MNYKMPKSVQNFLMAIALFAVGAVGFTTASIVSPLSTPAAQAGWIDRLPVPTGAYLNINGHKYFYGDLNNLSRVLPGVAWQINGGENGGVLLKGYGNVPRAIIDLVNKLFFKPVLVE
jgi:hypothetical protein